MSQGANPVYTFRTAQQEPTLKTTHPDAVAQLSEYINASAAIQDKDGYVTLMQGITEIISKNASQLTVSNPIYEKELERLGKNESNFKTPWGGVAFKELSFSQNRVEKLLIVEQARTPAGVLGFEYHNKKDEKLEILEGYALFMSSGPVDSQEKSQVTLTFAQPGDTCELHPGVRHGVIALTNLVIKETSTCDLDKEDLLFEF